MSYLEYKGFPLFPIEFLPLNKIQKNINHNRIVLGKPYNYNFYLWNESEYYNIDVEIKFDDYYEFDKIRQFFIYNKGMQGLFWFYSYVNELTIINDVNQGSIFLDVEIPFLDKVFLLRPLFIYIPELNFITKIVNVESNDFIDNKKIGKIELEDPVPEDIISEKCKRFCFAHLGRLGKDDLSFNFIDLFRGSVNFNFKEITVAHYKLLNLFRS